MKNILITIVVLLTATLAVRAATNKNFPSIQEPTSQPTVSVTVAESVAPIATPIATPIPTSVQTPKPTSTTAPTPKPTEKPTSTCDPNYSGACVPIASDVDCAGGSGNGPAYVRGPVTVIGRDIYDLDRDGNGIGCE